MSRFIVMMMLMMLTCARIACGQNIDMSTLPPRDSVQLTIYNSADLTLVRETRHVTMRKGSNQLQFSWANTLIDASSVTLRTKSPGLELIDTRFPHDRPQVLYWTIQAESDGDATVEISYFTSGISWAADYVGVVDRPEETMVFEGFVTITNDSGEDYENANVRLVVGTINLVEQIRMLAERGIVELVEGATRIFGEPRAADLDGDGMAKEELLRLDLGLPSGGSGGGGGFGGGLIFGSPKDIEKDAISEYFLFTVPGTETVKNGWSKRMRLFEGTRVPFRIEYRHRPEEYDEELARVFLVRNDEASTLGESPLPDGDVRLFQSAADSDGLSVLAFLETKYVPIGQEFEFNLGEDPQVIRERIVERVARDDFWFRVGGTDRLVSPTQGERIEQNYEVAGWNDHEMISERIRNYRDKPVTIAWRFPIEGDVTFRSDLDPTLFDYRTPEFTTRVEAGSTKDIRYELIQRQGSNAKEEHVQLAR